MTSFLMMTAMSGSVVDLSHSLRALPNTFLVDTNIIFELVEHDLLSRIPDHIGGVSGGSSLRVQRSASLFREMHERGLIGVVSPTAFAELLHVSIRLFLKQRGLRSSPKLDWRAVYKESPTAIREIEPALRQLQRLLERNGLFFVQPDQMRAVDSFTSWHDRLIATCANYGLDTGDAQILLEAEQLGIHSIVTMDADMRRAADVFDVYTWT
jgi:predicted nucleic acid-binding protein